MKHISIVLLIAIIISTLLITSCKTTDNGRPKDEIQEEYNQATIYFFKTEGPKYLKYIELDLNLTVRDKLTSKRKLQNINDLINLMKNE